MALTFEINGTSTTSRGAELTAIAIAERLRQSFPEARIVVPPNFGPFLLRGHHGFFTTWEMPTGVRTKTISRFAPRPLKRAFGIVNPEEVDVVLDASGFGLTDRRSSAAAANLAKKMAQRNRRHQLLILLPQPLGPFEAPAFRRTAKTVIDRAALVCARDEASFQAAAALCDSTKLRRFPDVTAGVKPGFPTDVTFPPHFSAIVPSWPLLKQPETSKAYLDFLFYAIFTLNKRHLNPVFVIHDSNEDLKVVEAVKDRGHDIAVLQHSDPKALKGMLGRATLVVGSPYHALLAALSQGVPCICAGENEVCPPLFKEFACADLVLPDVKDLRLFETQVEKLENTPKREARRLALLTASQQAVADSAEMWDEVEALIRQRVQR